MIHHELAQVWITTDGKRFLDKNKALTHEKTIEIHKQAEDELKDIWNEM